MAPVVPGFGNANVAITYQLYRERSTITMCLSTWLPLPSTFLCYTTRRRKHLQYIIRALSKKTDANLYPGHNK
jgi:hypothetical protein